MQLIDFQQTKVKHENSSLTLIKGFNFLPFVNNEARLEGTADDVDWSLSCIVELLIEY